MSTPRELPQQFGKYQIERKLGQGGMGAVYLALDPQLGRKVALKVPFLDRSDGASILQRFQREARLAAGIHHPHLCPVHEVGQVGDVLYFTMPYIEGTPLSQLIDEERPWEPAAAAELVIKVASALHELHRRGIIHRDLKPGNVMVLESGEPILMDFGLARTYAAQTRKLTSTTTPIGTPAYMSPEQVTAGTELGPATDIYSLGVILHELVTGRLPFEGPLAAVFAQILYAQPRPPSALRPGLDPALETVILKAMAKNPAERFPDLMTFVQALRAVAVPAPAGPGSVPVLPGSATVPPALPGSIRRTDRQPASAQETMPMPASTGRRSRLLGGLVASVLLALAIAAGVHFALHAGKDEQTPTRIASDGTTRPALPTSEDKTVPTRPTQAARPTRPLLRPRVEIAKLPTVTLRVGSSTEVTIAVRRSDFKGRVSLKVEQVGPGLEARVGAIEEGLETARLQLTADIFAPDEARTLRVLAEGEGVRDSATLRVTLLAPKPGTSARNSLKQQMVFIPPGQFQMGSPATEKGRDEQEGPRHPVQITRGFWMAAHEVTVGQFRDFVTDRKYHGGKDFLTEAERDPRGGWSYNFRQGPEYHWKNLGIPQSDEHPVVNVTWNDALAFCKWLSEKEKRFYDLPTEAEWEYACRAGSEKSFCFGDDERKLDDHAWYYKNSGKQPNPVGRKTPNAWGLYDMHGNAWEWCLDGMRQYQETLIKDPTGPLGGTVRVLRGGSWGVLAKNTRCASRNVGAPSLRDCNGGFRVILRPYPRTP